ncbi:hypothetical protein ES703_54430 [subsurface metagenome]
MDSLILFMALTIISIGFTIFYVNRASKQTEITLNSLGRQLDQGIQDINSQLDPIMKTNSRAMGHLQSLGDDTRIENTLDRKIGLDLKDQYGDIYEGIKLVFPRVAEYLDDRPEAITKLLPRLNTLISDPETRKRLNLDLSGKSGDLSRIWREE